MESNEISEFNLARLLAILWRWKFLILLCALVPGGAALAVSLLVPPTFEAQAAVAVVKSSTQLILDPRFRTISELDTYTYSDPASRQKLLVQVVNNPEIATVVIERMGDQLSETQRNPTVLARSISASNKGDLILITARARRPELAAALATLWAQEYQAHVNALYTESMMSLSELKAQMAAAKKDYEASQAALTAYIADNPVERLNQQVTEVQKILAAYQAAQVTSVTDLYAIQTKLDRLIADATSLRARIATEKRPGTVGSELATLFLEVNAFNTSLDLPTNPQAPNAPPLGLNAPASLQITLEQPNPGASAADQIARLDVLISTLQDRRKTIQASADARAKELVAAPDAAASGDSLRQSIDQLQKQVNRLQAQLELENAKKQELVRARDLAWTTYSTLASKVTETQVVAQDRGSLVRLAMPAAVPVESGWFRTVVNVLLALTVGGVAGVGLAFAFQALDRRVRNEEEVAKQLRLPTLGTVPNFSRQIATDECDNGHHAPALVTLDANAPASAMFSFIRHNVLTDDRAWRVLAVTSAMPGEGKSTIAANLAVRSAQAGQTVLLVDADLRRPTLHRLFGLENTRGLTDILNGDAKQWQSLVQATPIPGLSVITSGALAHDSAALLETPELARWLEQAKQAADLVIVDTPAALGVADAMIIARRTDAILLVVAQVPQDEAIRARDRLAATRVPIVGVVLNRVDHAATSLPFWKYYQTTNGN